METEDGRMTPDEAQAVIALWSQRQWERRHWPTAADIAEGLEISVAEAEGLLREVRTHLPASLGGLPKREDEEGKSLGNDLFTLPLYPLPRLCEQGREGRRPWRRGGFLRLTTAIAGLTGFFCLFLSRLLS